MLEADLIDPRPLRSSVGSARNMIRRSKGLSDDPFELTDRPVRVTEAIGLM